MPTDVIVSLQGVTNLSRDRYVNVLHFDGDDWDTNRLDELWSKYDAFISGGMMAGLAAGGHSIAAYRPGPNPSGPYVRKEYTRAAAVGYGGPTEVACCLSYATVDDPETSTPRRRGRIFLGPIKSTTLDNQGRPNSVLLDQVLDLGEGIAQVGMANNTTWMHYSKLDNAYTKIESIWVDDAWDIQRKRGLAPTAKTVRDVQ